MIRLPGLTPYGTREALTVLALTALLCLVCIVAGVPWLAVLPAAVGAWGVSFFRDPPRTPPDNPRALLSPADGTVTHIEEVEEPVFIGGRAKMIGIFLSIFNVHLNRAPFPGTVRLIRYTPGRFHDARNPDSSRENENNAIGIETAHPEASRLLVRQISGAIARRIVCDCREGAELEAGQVIGMIKFGSRTELYLPAGAGLALRVRVGDRVYAGTTVLGELS